MKAHSEIGSHADGTASRDELPGADEGENLVDEMIQTEDNLVLDRDEATDTGMSHCLSETKFLHGGVHLVASTDKIEHFVAITLTNRVGTWVSLTYDWLSLADDELDEWTHEVENDPLETIVDCDVKNSDSKGES